MTLEEFKSNKKKKKVSLLDKFKDEILELYNDGYSQETIVEFLKSKKIKTTRQNVSRYLKKTTQQLQKKKTIESKEIKEKVIKIAQEDDRKVEIQKEEIKTKEFSDNKNNNFLNTDFTKKVGKDTSLKIPDWL